MKMTVVNFLNSISSLSKMKFLKVKSFQFFLWSFETADACQEGVLSEPGNSYYFVFLLECFDEPTDLLSQEGATGMSAKECPTIRDRKHVGYFSFFIFNFHKSGINRKISRRVTNISQFINESIGEYHQDFVQYSQSNILSYYKYLPSFPGQGFCSKTFLPPLS